jgi:glucose-6-phosphate 1-epimerase
LKALVCFVYDFSDHQSTDHPPSCDFRPFVLKSKCVHDTQFRDKSMTNTSSRLAILNDRLALPGLAQVVAGNGDLPKVQITTPQASAEIYLHGAQLTSWIPSGASDVIFLSTRSKWAEGSAIRGGVPICFPWFRAKADDPKAPSHGFVRIKSWELDAITREGDLLIVTLSTESDDATRKWWPHDFQLQHRITVGAELKMELVMRNTGTTPATFEEALHTYHRVGDAMAIRIGGLDEALYLDNTDANREKTQHGDIAFTKQTDNAYLNTTHDLEIIDPELKRRIINRKENTLTTVVWNPWQEGAASMSDLGKDEWQVMACAEASNIRDFAVTLQPGAAHTMAATIRVDPL